MVVAGSPIDRLLADDEVRGRLAVALRGGGHFLEAFPEGSLGELRSLSLESLVTAYRDAGRPVRSVANDRNRWFQPEPGLDPVETGTLSFQDVGTVVPAVGRLQTALSVWLGVRVVCNAYYSRGQTQFPGISTHTDEYPVVILHLDGRKRWQLGPMLPRTAEIGLPKSALEHPFPGWFSAAFASGSVTTPVEHDIVMEPGMVLGIPPGMWHGTEAIDRSLSLSFGARAPVWTGVLRHVTRGLAYEVAPELFEPAYGLYADESDAPWEALRRLSDGFSALRANPERCRAAFEHVFGAGTMRWPGGIDPANDQHPCATGRSIEGTADIEAPARGWDRGTVDATELTRIGLGAAVAASLRDFGPGHFAFEDGRGSLPEPPRLQPRDASTSWAARTLAPSPSTRIYRDFPEGDGAWRTFCEGLGRAIGCVDDVRASVVETDRATPWFANARDVVMVLLDGTGTLERGRRVLLSDDDDPEQSMVFMRPAAMPSPAVHCPVPVVSAHPLRDGAVAVIPRGTFMRVTGTGPLRWASVELHMPSWMRLLEMSLLSAAATSTALSATAFELYAGDWRAPDVSECPAVAEHHRSLKRWSNPSWVWPLWRDRLDYLPGQLLEPAYVVLEHESVSDVNAEMAPAVEWMRAVDRPFYLSGFARRCTPPVPPAEAFALLEAWAERGIVRRAQSEDYV